MRSPNPNKTLLTICPNELLTCPSFSPTTSAFRHHSANIGVVTSESNESVIEHGGFISSTSHPHVEQKHVVFIYARNPTMFLTAQERKGGMGGRRG
jgi:hypothetical protein